MTTGAGPAPPALPGPASPPDDEVAPDDEALPDDEAPPDEEALPDEEAPPDEEASSPLGPVPASGLPPLLLLEHAAVTRRAHGKITARGAASRTKEAMGRSKVNLEGRT